MPGMVGMMMSMVAMVGTPAPIVNCKQCYALGLIMALPASLCHGPAPTLAGEIVGNLVQQQPFPLMLFQRKIQPNNGRCVSPRDVTLSLPGSQLRCLVQV